MASRINCTARYHTGAHVLYDCPLYRSACGQVGLRSSGMLNSEDTESTYLQQPTKFILDYCSCLRHHFITREELFLLLLIVVTFCFSSSSCGSHSSMIASGESSLYKVQEFSVMTVSDISDDTCRSIGTSDNVNKYEKMSVFYENKVPPIALPFLGLDWELFLAPMHSENFNPSLTNMTRNGLHNSANTGMIPHPSFADSNLLRYAQLPEADITWTMSDHSLMSTARGLMLRPILTCALLPMMILCETTSLVDIALCEKTIRTIFMISIMPTTLLTQ